jgi:hypothetical protein
LEEGRGVAEVVVVEDQRRGEELTDQAGARDGVQGVQSDVHWDGVDEYPDHLTVVGGGVDDEGGG